MMRVDARGLLCPMPVIRVQNQARDMAVGTELEILATDPGVLHDIPAWCRVHGHDVLVVQELSDHIALRIRLGAETSALF